MNFDLMSDSSASGWTEVVTNDISLVCMNTNIRYHKKLNMKMSDYNAGVVGFNLEKWRDEFNITVELLYWMKLHVKKNLWSLGSQPQMYALAGNDVDFVDKRWNMEGLGWDMTISNHSLSSGYILHWNGKSK